MPVIEVFVHMEELEWLEKEAQRRKYFGREMHAYAIAGGMIGLAIEQSDPAVKRAIDARLRMPVST